MTSLRLSVCLFICCCFYILATSKVISGWAHSWPLYSAASLGHQATSTMTCYPTQSQYPDTDPTIPFPILIMLSARLGSNQYQFQSLWFDSTRFQTCGLWARTHDLRIPRSSRMGAGHSTHLATTTGSRLSVNLTQFHTPHD